MLGSSLYDWEMVWHIEEPHTHPTQAYAHSSSRTNQEKLRMQAGAHKYVMGILEFIHTYYTNVRLFAL